MNKTRIRSGDGVACMPGDDRVDPSGRFAAHRTVAAALTDLPDADLADLLAHGRALGSGIGGTVVTFEVEGVTVFAKSIALTEVERRPENHGSSADLFGLPTFYQYPIGSTGFGAWRELAAHTMTTEWV